MQINNSEVIRLLFPVMKNTGIPVQVQEVFQDYLDTQVEDP